MPGKSARENPQNPKVVYLLNADDYDDSLVDDGAFVIYQVRSFVRLFVCLFICFLVHHFVAGRPAERPTDSIVDRTISQGHHGDKGAARADVVLPAAAYTEKYATYVNTEGRAQTTKNAVSTLADSRVDWEIVRALSEVCGAPLPVDDLDAVRARMADVAPSLTRRNELVVGGMEVRGDWWSGYRGERGDERGLRVSSWVDEFYMTDVVSRASKVMARCVKYKQG